MDEPVYLHVSTRSAAAAQAAYEHGVKLPLAYSLPRANDTYCVQWGAVCSGVTVSAL